jgi:hypothetical protein
MEITAPTKAASIPDSTNLFQNCYPADPDNYLPKSPDGFEDKEPRLLHQLSLLSEERALRKIPGCKLEKFVFLNMLPVEIQNTL